MATTAAQPVHEGVFTLGPDGAITLLGGFSPTSGKYHFPRLDTCPYSGARDIQPVDLSGLGSLWGWTAVTAAPPGYAGPVPFGFGVVELEKERLRVVTRLTVADPTALVAGQPMKIVADQVDTTEDGAPIITWAFAPSGDPS